MAHNVLYYNVKCNAGFELILRVEDKSASCVTPSTANRLVDIKWGAFMPKKTESEGNLTLVQKPPVANLLHNATQTSTPSYQLAFFLNYQSTEYNTNLQLLGKHLKPGDSVLLSGSIPTASEISQRVQEVRSVVSPGVNVYTTVGFRSINKLALIVPTLPKGVDFIQYDYETWSDTPEFSKNMTISSGYFDQAKAAIIKYNTNTGSNAKLMVDPSYKQLGKANWDWGRVAQHMDLMNIQFQEILQHPNVQNDVSSVLSQTQKESPNTLVFIQLSVNPKVATPQDSLNAINVFKVYPGINSFLIFYFPNQTPYLEQFFNMLVR
jgi:hypothetical protein